VRHCQPDLNRSENHCIGKMDIPLSDAGREQAKNLREYFSNKDISEIYSSNLKRAWETAEILADNKFSPIIKHNFSELDTGKWDGLSFDEIKRIYPEEYKKRGEDLENYVVEGGESMAMCRKRAITELNNTLNNSKGNVIIVTHAGVIRTILSSVLEISIKETFDCKFDYGSINLLTASNIDGERRLKWNL